MYWPRFSRHIRNYLKYNLLTSVVLFLIVTFSGTAFYMVLFMLPGELRCGCQKPVVVGYGTFISTSGITEGKILSTLHWWFINFLCFSTEFGRDNAERYNALASVYSSPMKLLESIARLKVGFLLGRLTITMLCNCFSTLFPCVVILRWKSARWGELIWRESIIMERHVGKLIRTVPSSQISRLKPFSPKRLFHVFV